MEDESREPGRKSAPVYEVCYPGISDDLEELGQAVSHGHRPGGLRVDW